MSQFLVQVREPSWWLSVFVVGILTSIFGTYIVRWLDNYISKASHARASRLAAQNDEFRRRVQIARNDEGELSRLRFDVLRSLVVGLVFLVTGSMVIIVYALTSLVLIPGNFFMVGRIALILVGVLSMSAGMNEFVGNTSYLVLMEAEKRNVHKDGPA